MKISKRLFLTTLFIIAIQINIPFALPPIPTEVKSIVTFIFIPDGKNEKLIANGTGFFVSIKNSKNIGSFSRYLVTSKHVIQTPDNKSFVPRIYVRMNKKIGGTEMLPLSLNISGSEKNVHFHKDKNVDLSVISISLDSQKYDFKVLTEDYLISKEDFKNLNIREGSEVFFTGLFSSHLGMQRNEPIVRFGRVALVTDEKINFYGANADLYVIEIGSYGGNSGSPVFFYLGVEREPGSIFAGPPVMKLAGIMEGYFGQYMPVDNIDAKKETPLQSRSNTGIAAVIPSYKLFEILVSDELNK